MAAFAAQAGPLFMGLGDLPGGDVYSEAAIVWANGSVVFGTSEIIDDDEEAFRWTNAGGMVGLGLLPGGSFDYSYANAASADGSVAVGYSGPGPDSDEAFIWDNLNGMRNLKDVLINDYGLGSSLAGWTLLPEAYGISADGLTVVGYGEHANADAEAGAEAWIARLDSAAVVPEPSSLILLGIAVAGLSGNARRRGMICNHFTRT